jgi:ABC-type lipoprotein release transport system permease subunit
VLAAVILVYVIVTGARSHRRDLAVLRAIGLGPNHVRRVLMWQGVLTTFVSVAVGLPIAIVAGAAMWRRVAGDTGVQRDPAIPSAIALIVPVALAVALGSAMLVHGRFRRSRVADLLHEE